MKTEVAISNGQSRENGTLGTQDTGQRQIQQIIISENRRGNQEWTIQRKWNIGYTRNRTKTNITTKNQNTEN